MTLPTMELYQNHSKVSDEIYDLRRSSVKQDIKEIRFVDNVYERTRDDRERFAKTPNNHQDTMECASDSSSESYKEIRRKQIERKNSSPVAAASAFTIDNILGRRETKNIQVPSNLNYSDDREEDQEEREAKMDENQFIRPTAVSATQSGKTITTTKRQLLPLFSGTSVFDYLSDLEKADNIFCYTARINSLVYIRL